MTAAHFAELPGLRGAATIRCQGDAHSARLRTARRRLENTAEEISAAAAAVRKILPYPDTGLSVKNILDALEDDFTENLVSEWFFRSGDKVRWEVTAAVEIEKFDINDAALEDLPARPTWEPLRTLAAALTNHGASIANLRRAESTSARNA